MLVPDHPDSVYSLPDFEIQGSGEEPLAVVLEGILGNPVRLNAELAAEAGKAPERVTRFLIADAFE